MADETEEIILEFTVDQGEALKEAAALKKSIIEIKQEQAELNAEFKKGTVGIDQYAAESVQLEKRLKTEQTTYGNLTKAINTNSNSRNALKLQVSKLTQEYDNLNRKTIEGAKRAEQLEKELADLNAQITKTSKSAGLFKDQIGNYPEAMKQATVATGNFGEKLAEGAKNAEVGGVSVAGLTSTVSKFINPATVAIGVLSALGSLYISSAAGAKDLQFATDQISTSFRIARNEFGDFIDSLTGGGGRTGTGLLSKAAIVFNATFFGQKKAVEALLASLAQQRLRELQLTEIDVASIRKLYEKGAEDARRVRDDETKTFEERLKASKTVEAQLSANLLVRESVQQRIIDQLKIIAKNDTDPAIRAQIKQAEAERSDAREEITGKLTENITAQRNLNKLIKEEAELSAGVARANQRLTIPSGATSDRIRPQERQVQPESAEDSVAAQQTQDLIRQKQIEVDATEELNNQILKSNENLDKETVKSRERAAELKKNIDETSATLQIQLVQATLNNIAGALDQQSEAYKVVASANAIINTYRAADAALATGSEINPIYGIAAAIAAITAGLANVAKINGVQFYEGGWTGPGGKYDVAGVVHADEYVAPKHIVHAPAAQPHIQALERMRLNGYAEGGLVTAAATAVPDQSVLIANTLKNMPAPIVSVKEFTRVEKRVNVKQNLARLNP